MKPREFWIDEGVNGFDLGAYRRWVAEFPSKEWIDGKIHVIEYSSVENMKNNYFQLMVENAKLIEKLTEENQSLTIHECEKCQLLTEQNKTLCDELEDLKTKHEELLSYLPKVPTEPYEKELARQNKQLKHEIIFWRSALCESVSNNMFQEYLNAISGAPAGHKETWACTKPDGDGCDGNHIQSVGTTAKGDG